jgi:hypothetical protein
MGATSSGQLVALPARRRAVLRRKVRLTFSPGRKKRCRSPRCHRRTGAGPRSSCGVDMAACSTAPPAPCPPSAKRWVLRGPGDRGRAKIRSFPPPAINPRLQSGLTSIYEQRLPPPASRRCQTPHQSVSVSPTSTSNAANPRRTAHVCVAGLRPWSSLFPDLTDFHHVVPRKLGVDVPWRGTQPDWAGFFSDCALTDVLDFVTAAWRHFAEKSRTGGLKEHRPWDRWLGEVQEIFQEEKRALPRR